MKLRLFIVLLIIFSLTDPAVSVAKEIISVGLITDHFSSLGDKVIVGGRLTVKGGVIEHHKHSGGDRIVNGPFPLAFTEEQDGRSTVSFSLLLTGTPDAPGEFKKRELKWLSNWFDIEVDSSMHPLACPSKECPIEIEGRLDFADDPSTPQFHKNPQKSVSVKTSDFKFKNVTIDINSIKSEAERGDVKAQFELGNLYSGYDTPGIAQDYTEAFKWYDKAAEKNFSAAQNKIGEMYAHGNGVEFDVTQAMKWWRLAAAAGNEDAQENLGYYYMSSKFFTGGKGFSTGGLESDAIEGLAWYRRAATQGSAYAQSGLASAFERGKGTNQDYSEAYFWYLLAATSNADNKFEKQSNEAGSKRVVSHLTPEQIDTIKRRAADWKPVKETR